MLRKRDRETWMEAFATLAGALGEVFRAELAILADDWQRWGKRLAKIAALGIAIMALCTSLVLLLTYAAMRFLEGHLGPVLAPLAVAAGVLVLILILGGLVYWLIRRAENPVLAVRDRYDDHRRWWRERVLAADERGREP